MIPTMFSLRSISEDDHIWLVELHNDPLVLRNITNPQPITLQSHMEWWSKIQLSKTEERFIFCVDGERAGIVKLYSIDHLNKNCVLGADLHKDFRGKGFARPMWNLMLQRCFEVHDLYRVSLTTAEFNTVAINLYRSLGFQEEGRLYASLLRDGIYRDQICMFKLRDTT